MKERPILFSAPMVNAILEGRKTMTRRVVKPQPMMPWRAWDGKLHHWQDGDELMRCSYGQPGDHLWVRETWNCIDTGRLTQRQDWVRYRATDGDEMYWRPSIFMPRWASRITLEVTGVRVERVQDITPEDCRSEGIKCSDVPRTAWRNIFSRLWNEINAKRGYGWSVNPWCWVVSFKRLEARQ